jgi:phosphopantothenate synthetase
MRWLRGHVRDDDGVDPARGIEAADMVWSRLEDGFRLALVDEAGAVISSIDLDRGDVHDTRAALTRILKVHG